MVYGLSLIFFITTEDFPTQSVYIDISQPSSCLLLATIGRERSVSLTRTEPSGVQKECIFLPTRKVFNLFNRSYLCLVKFSDDGFDLYSVYQDHFVGHILYSVSRC